MKRSRNNGVADKKFGRNAAEESPRVVSDRQFFVSLNK